MHIPKKVVKQIRRQIRDKEISINLKKVLKGKDKRTDNVIFKKGGNINVTA